MNRKFLLFILFVSLFLTGCVASSFNNYITTSKDRLMDGEEEFRFVSFNIPNLHYIEDHLAFDASSPWRLPDEFEIRDALTAIKQLGGKVARTYTLSVRKPGESKNIIRHVEAPGVFNEEAFIALDKVMQIANEVGVRIIIPFVDNWWWWGGPVEYAAFRNKPKEAFFTDAEIINDLKKTIAFLVNRKNTFTGILYKEDKALFGWETGNEMEAPYSWTAEIAEYIQSLDPNHVVIEGTHINILTEEAINDPNIDILSTHHYSPGNVSVERILKNKELSRNKKPYFVGEFGLRPPEEIKMVLDSTMNNDVSGIMIWSLRFRNRDGGFYLHRENTGSGPYRFPGFASGENYNEKKIIDLMRQKAFEIDGKTPPPLAVPIAPVLLDIPDIYSISWKGSTGASSYIVERRKINEENWLKIAENISDAESGYRPLFIDSNAVLNEEYFYRIYAQNESGISEASNEVGPVKVKSLKIIDELKDDSKIFIKEGNSELIQFQDIYRAKEDNSRLKVDSLSSVIYLAPEDILSFKLYLFSPDPKFDIEILASDSLNNFEPVTTKIETFPPYFNVYQFFTPVLFTSEEFPPETKYIKILFNKEAQISRVEIEYTGTNNQNKNLVKK